MSVFRLGRRRRSYRGRTAPAAYSGRLLYTPATEAIPDKPARPPEQGLPRFQRWWWGLSALRRWALTPQHQS